MATRSRDFNVAARLRTAPRRAGPAFRTRDARRWVIVDLLGKGRHRRTIPVPGLGQGVDRRVEDRGRRNRGCVFRAMNKGGRVYGTA